MDVGVEVKGRPGDSETLACSTGTRCRGPIRPRSVSVRSVRTINTIQKKKKKEPDFGSGSHFFMNPNLNLREPNFRSGSGSLSVQT